MATIPYAKPSPYLDGNPASFAFDSGLMTVGQTIAEGDLLTMTGAGTVSKAASNINASILGFAAHAGADIYYSGVGGSAAAKSHQSFFGASQAGTALFSSDPLSLHWWKLGQGCWAEMSLLQAFAQSSVGAAVGMTLDATTGIWLADTTATACATIIRLMEGVPNAPGLGQGTYGDLGCRVLVKFDPTKLAH